MILRAYSHQEGPIVHLLSSRPKIIIIFFILVRLAFTLYVLVSGPKFANEATRPEVVQLLDRNDTSTKH